jgi:hypothetical protein
MHEQIGPALFRNAPRVDLLHVEGNEELTRGVH